MKRTAPRSESPSPVARRGLLAGAGVAAGAAVAAHLASRGAVAPQPEATAEKAKPGGEPAGYRLTAHVQRYYETTKA
jgi:hypothetical protein